MKRGFTLVEVTLTLSIFVVLIGLSLFVLNTARQQGLRNKASGEMAALAVKIEVVRNESKQTMATISSGAGACDASNQSGCGDRWARYRISPAPIDPWNKPYIMSEREGNPGCEKDLIISAGPDGNYTTNDILPYEVRFYTRACLEA